MWTRPAIRKVLVAVAVLATGAGMAHAQVSPGPLAEAHRDLDKPLDCFKCHVRPGARGTMDAQCLACHEEISALKTARRGYHAKLDAACASCHPDHAGRDFDLVSWGDGGSRGFDHRKAGWPLEGAHARVECRECHQTQFQKSPIASRIKVRDRSRSWLGLQTDCASCHEDVHRGQVGTRCETCHGLAKWKPADRFDHAKSRYALTGKHADVACEKCHRTETAAGAAAGAKPVAAHDGGGGRVRYRPLPHEECSSCHRDPHAGRFGAQCAKCHDTKGFMVVSERGFEHDLTRYPLRGKHARVACAQCHDPKRAWGKRPAFAACGSCHRDAHAGQATLAGAPADCAACHTVADFAVSTFTAERHRATPYALEGAHARAECRLCHARGVEATAAKLGSARVIMRPAAARCIDCHRDPHGQRPAAARARAGREPCLECHDLGTFHPSRVNVAAHAAFAYPLIGAHGAVPCQACHAELAKPPAASSLRQAQGRPLLFHEKHARCADCHADPHGGQFAARPDSGACQTCHGLDTFTPATRFDHGRQSSFRLEGVHARVACAACHRTEKTPRGPRTIWKPVAGRCEDCHRPATKKSRSSALSPRAPRAATLLLTTREVTHETQAR